MRLIVLCAVFLTVVYGECPKGWQEFRTKCYNMHDTPKKWEEAQADCEKEGATLVDIPDRETDDFVQALHEERIWLAVNDIDEEQNYVVGLGGPKAEYLNFNNYGNMPKTMDSQDCVVMTKGDQTHWNDLPCSASHRFACEKSQD